MVIYAKRLIVSISRAAHGNPCCPILGKAAATAHPGERFLWNGVITIFKPYPILYYFRLPWVPSMSNAKIIWADLVQGSKNIMRVHDTKGVGDNAHKIVIIKEMKKP